MRKLVLSCITLGAFAFNGNAQTLFTYGPNSVSKDEFLRVYQKNSINKKVDFSEPALREYFDLYSLFKMKVKEAELQHLDTLTSIDNELSNYRKQLAKNYLTDEKVRANLIHEAYDRSKEEVEVAHILIFSSQMSASADTLVPYNKIDSIYKAIIAKKASFEEMAKKFSDDKASATDGGNIGYITALQTVYPIENVAYTTPVGKISAPFRSQFGYHIVKVLNKRPGRGEIQVAQIMAVAPKSKGEAGLEAARKKIDSVQRDLKAGASFESLVKKYSDDKFSVNEDGILPVFGVGKMTPAFENAAYNLKKAGDISAPVQTEYGYHIIKLIEKYPLKPFDSVEQRLKRQVEADSRAQVAHESFFNKIKQKNGFKEYPANLDAVSAKFIKIPDTGKAANTFKASDFSNMNQPLFTLAGKPYLQSDFVTYAESVTRGRLSGPKNLVTKDLYNMYVTSVVNNVEEHKLEDEHPEFKNMMNEYRDGIMLFELMDRNVWSKASKDTAGLRAYYESHKGKYQWEPGFMGAVYRFKNEKALKQGQQLLAQKSISDEDVIKKMNSDTLPDAVTIQRGHYEFSKFNEVPKDQIKANSVTSAKKNTDGTYTVVKVGEVFTSPTVKSLEDARGYAVAEYQDYLEQEWNAQMKKKYPVKLDEQVFKTMVK